MQQLEGELSLVELPCMVNKKLFDKFCEDLVDQGSQRHDDSSSDDSTVIEPVSSRENTLYITSTGNQEEESKDENEIYKSFNRTINLSSISEKISPEHSFNHHFHIDEKHAAV